jgi:hypothetical protein
MAEDVLIRFAVAWTLVGAFVFTVVVTCLSVIGVVKFADAKQQEQLFAALVLQLAIIGVTYFGRILNFSPESATGEVIGLTNYAYWASFRHGGVAPIDKPRQFANEYRYAFEDVEGAIKYHPALGIYVESNRRPNAPSYYYFFRPIRTEDDFLYVYDDYRSFALKLPLRSGKAYFCANGANGPFSDFHSVIALY